MGSLSVPNTFGAASGNVPAGQLDADYAAIVTYVNAREVTVGLIGARPAASTAGRYYLATDVNGGTLYVDTGTAWQQAGAGVTISGVPAILSQQTGDSTVTGTLVETSLKSFSVPGGTLITNGDLLRVTVSCRVSGDLFTKRLQLKFGASIIADSGNTFDDGNARDALVQAWIMRLSATTQRGSSLALQSIDAQSWNTATLGGNRSSVPGETLAGAVLLDVTGTLGDVSSTAICDLLLVEVLRP